MPTQTYYSHLHASFALSCGTCILFSNDALCNPRIWTRGDFSACPTIGKTVHLAISPIASWNNVFLLFTPASIKHPMLHEVLRLCSIHLMRQLDQRCITLVHFLIYNPERSINILPIWYALLRDHFIESNIGKTFQYRVYVSKKSVTVTHGR